MDTGSLKAVAGVGWIDSRGLEWGVNRAVGWLHCGDDKSGSHYEKKR